MGSFRVVCDAKTNIFTHQIVIRFSYQRNNLSLFIKYEQCLGERRPRKFCPLSLFPIFSLILSIFSHLKYFSLSNSFGSLCHHFIIEYYNNKKKCSCSLIKWDVKELLNTYRMILIFYEVWVKKGVNKKNDIQ